MGEGEGPRPGRRATRGEGTNQALIAVCVRNRVGTGWTSADRAFLNNRGKSEIRRGRKALEDLKRKVTFWKCYQTGTLLGIRREVRCGTGLNHPYTFLAQESQVSLENSGPNSLCTRGHGCPVCVLTAHTKSVCGLWLGLCSWAPRAAVSLQVAVHLQVEADYEACSFPPFVLGLLSLQ